MLYAAGVAAAYIAIENFRKRKQKCWVCDYFEDRNVSVLNEVRTDSSKLFKNFNKMSPSDFEELLPIIGPDIQKNDTNMRQSVPPITRLAITLRFLTTGDSYHSLMYTFKISVSNIIPEVCGAIIKGLKDDYKKRIREGK